MPRDGKEATDTDPEEGPPPSSWVEICQSRVHGPPACDLAGAPPAVDMSCRDFCDMMGACTPILEELDMARMPHWTTLHKSSKRADTRRFERFLLVFLNEARLSMLNLGTDGTGYDQMSAKMHYVCVTGRRIRSPDRPRSTRPVRYYLKQTLAVEDEVSAHRGFVSRTESGGGFTGLREGVEQGRARE